MSKQKILKIDVLAGVIEQLRSKGDTIVHCHGVFDLLHIGHIRYLEQAKLMGSVLVVTVTPDRFVDKGPDRPEFPEDLRLEAIASLQCVDYVSLNQWPTAEETLRLLRPHMYVKGSEFKDISTDMTGKIAQEKKVVDEIGAGFAFTDDVVFSSSHLINRYLSNRSSKIREYLKRFTARFTTEEVLEELDKMASLNVIVIGDAILDEYSYCEVIGVSSKDPMMAVKHDSHETFAGGVFAVANHLSSFVSKVSLATVLGEQDSREDFIRSNLRDNVVPFYWKKKTGPTTIKRRYIEVCSLSKLLEVYFMDESELPNDDDADVCQWLHNHLSEFDLVVVADFGHGAISKSVAQCLASHARFLAVNTQANAGNRGYHTISKYSRADLVCLAEHEIRLEMRDKTGPLGPMMNDLATKLGCGALVVTRGNRGSLTRDRSGFIDNVPSFAGRVVDPVGAGDAFFAVAALAAARKTPVEMLGFFGNCAGCLAAGSVGNRSAVEKLPLKKYIKTLMS